MWHIGSFRTWAPRLYVEIDSCLNKLLEHDGSESMLKPYGNVIFPMMQINVGPRTFTLPHRDHQNYAPGWCAITALGEFDHTAGGQLVLWDLHQIVEFPAGSTILIPSATMLHSNVQIGFEETRMSVTQFIPAGLIRWVDAGFRSMSALQDSDPEALRALRDGEATRVAHALSLYSFLDEILDGFEKPGESNDPGNA